jgi:hypothetical protein
MFQMSRTPPARDPPLTLIIVIVLAEEAQILQAGQGDMAATLNSRACD